METGVVFNVQKYSVHDGPGIRTTVFLKGCPLRCWWCHNPESQDKEPFIHYDEARCLHCDACLDACRHGALSSNGTGVVVDTHLCVGDGLCARACPSEAREQVGRRVSVEEVLERVEQDRLYYEESGGGVTFSGGEPLFQWPFLLELLKACGERDLHRTVDTTGYAQTGVLLDVARETDLFLYDLKLMDPELHQKVTGVPLEPIVENLARLLETGARVRIRIPMIPGITSDESIRRTADLLVSLPPVEGVHLLPFHKSARDKHEKFGVPWRLDTTEIPAGAEERWAAMLRDRGLPVTIGG